MPVVVVNTKDIELHVLESELGVFCDIKPDIVDTIKKSTVRGWVPTILMGYGDPLPLKRGDNTRDFDYSDQSTNGWIALVREELYSNPSVEDIFVSIEDNNVDVWAVIPQRDIAVLHQLADIEWELLEMFVSGEHPVFLIDFHVIYRCGRDIEDLAPTRAIRLIRQVQ